MPVDKVWYHHSFQFGSNNSEKFQDLAFMSNAHTALLDDFVMDLLSGEALHGRNKPSWLDKNGNILKIASGYEKSNVWHYHVGKHNTSLPPTTDNIRTQNLDIQVSSEVIHYTWQGKETQEIIVLGFSPNHKNFPLAIDKKNPLRARTTTFKYSKDKLIDPNNV